MPNDKRWLGTVVRWYGVTFGSVVTPALSRTEREFVAECMSTLRERASVLVLCNYEGSRPQSECQLITLQVKRRPQLLNKYTYLERRYPRTRVEHMCPYNGVPSGMVWNIPWASVFIQWLRVSKRVIAELSVLVHSHVTLFSHGALLYPFFFLDFLLRMYASGYCYPQAPRSDLRLTKPVSPTLRASWCVLVPSFQFRNGRPYRTLQRLRMSDNLLTGLYAKKCVTVLQPSFVLKSQRKIHPLRSE